MQNELYQETEVEELSIEQALSAFGADPEFNEFLESSSIPVDVIESEDTPTSRLISWA